MLPFTLMNSGSRKANKSTSHIIMIMRLWFKRNDHLHLIHQEVQEMVFGIICLNRIKCFCMFIKSRITVVFIQKKYSSMSKSWSWPSTQTSCFIVKMFLSELISAGVEPLFIKVKAKRLVVRKNRSFILLLGRQSYDFILQIVFKAC